jgi:hypothetical protein
MHIGRIFMKTLKSMWITELGTRISILSFSGHHDHLTSIATNKQRKRKRNDNYKNVRFEVSTAVTMKNGVFWDVMLCGSCKNRRFGRTWRLFHQGDKNR